MTALLALPGACLAAAVAHARAVPGAYEGASGLSGELPRANPETLYYCPGKLEVGSVRRYRSVSWPHVSGAVEYEVWLQQPGRMRMVQKAQVTGARTYTLAIEVPEEFAGGFASCVIYALDKDGERQVVPELASI